MSSEGITRASRQKSDEWRHALNRYRTPNTNRGIFELAVTAIPFAVAWSLMCVAVYEGYVWLYALLLLPTAGLLVRLFIIQHDCGHGAFFPHRQTNEWVGRALSVLTVTPYDHWRRSHAIHHATSSNLDRRGVGDLETLTVSEYSALSPLGRQFYRVYRHPLVLFCLGPIYFFLLQNRLPIGFMRKGWTPWISTMSTNIGVAALAVLIVWSLGLKILLLVHLPVVCLGAIAGVWLFYVQHQFEHTHWTHNDQWTPYDAAFLGSSYYDLPKVLNWFTANIGIHHVHHLSSQIPFYRLPDVLRDFPELRDLCKMTLSESLKCVPLTLWDEGSRRLISFAEFDKGSALSQA